VPCQVYSDDHNVAVALYSGSCMTIARYWRIGSRPWAGNTIVSHLPARFYDAPGAL